MLNSSRVHRDWNDPPGFNAVEVLITVSIVAIFFAIAIPGVLGGIQRTGVDGAARRLADDIRLAQSNALTRGVQARLIAFNDSGVATNPGSSDITDTTKANKYRVEIRSGASASWPSLTDYPGGNSNVLTVWNELGTDYRGVSITTGNTLIFNSQGFLQNSTTPLQIVVGRTGDTKTVQTSVIGRASIQ